jgi:predicted unusual protein kinase regulating ubiquinone biosynthesis (AarF/ABC1/UbiB family)
MLRARYRRIVLFFARILLSFIFWDLTLPRLGLRRLAVRSRSKRLSKSAVAFRALAIEMGGVMIKVGQFLSSRVDVLPPELTDELNELQDEVPPETFTDIQRVAETEFGMSLGKKFAAFDETPLAAASLGQVHRALIRKSPDSSPEYQHDRTDGARSESWQADVVVKIQRPNIEQIIETDLAALRTVGGWLHYYPPIRKRANVPLLLSEFSRILLEEIDYLAEGRNAETFATNFRGFPGVRVPGVVWTHTTRRALTLENVLAIKVTDYQAISEAGIDRAEVASRLLKTYLKQIFEDGFFHADPHPGNLFVNPIPVRPGITSHSNTAWELTFVDFGMVGHVPDNLRNGLRELMIGIGTQDTARVIKSYQMMDILLPGADLSMLERMEARAFEKFWGKNMDELTKLSYQDMKDFADEFRDLLFDMPFQMPQNMIFLARCVGILSGMCTGLDPKFNLWDHLVPFAQKIISEEVGAGLAVWMAEIEKLARALFRVPGKLDSVLTKLDRGELITHDPEMIKEMHKLERSSRQITGGIIFASLLLSGIQLYLGGEGFTSGLLLIGAFIALIITLLGGRNRTNKKGS